MKIPLNPSLECVSISDLPKIKDDIMVQTCTEQAVGAYPNGSRVMKSRDDPGDTHKVGDEATVVGSIGPVSLDGKLIYGYFVNWNDMPEIPVFIAGPRIKLIEETK